MPKQSCLTCGYRTLNPQKCPLIGYEYADAANNICPYWVVEAPKCDLCGQVDPNSVLTQFSDTSWKRLCGKCMSSFGTCRGCVKSQGCDFETNPSPLPKAVQKRIQQGNQIIVTTVKNEERVKETCAKNCQCFCQETRTCLREYECCKNYEEVTICVDQPSSN